MLHTKVQAILPPIPWRMPMSFTVKKNKWCCNVKYFYFLWDLFILQTPPVSASNPIPLSYHPKSFFTLGGYYHCRHFSKSGLCPPPTDRTLSGLNCKTWFQRCHLTGPYSELIKKSGKLTPTQTHTHKRETQLPAAFSERNLDSDLLHDYMDIQ